LSQLYFVGTRIDYEKKVSLVDDLAVLEVDFRKRTSDLSPQLDTIGGGELA
jgi:hypothetical protein